MIANYKHLSHIMYFIFTFIFLKWSYNKCIQTHFSQKLQTIAHFWLNLVLSLGKQLVTLYVWIGEEPSAILHWAIMNAPSVGYSLTRK